MEDPSAPLWFPSKPGVYNLPFRVYQADDSALSSGVIKKFIHLSPKHARSRLASSGGSTPPMRTGRGFHKRNLEPRTYRAEFPIYDGRRAGRVFEDFAQAHPEAHRSDILSPKEALTIDQMTEALSEDENALHLVTRGIAESTIYCRHEETGLWLKSRPDALHADKIVDLKTTAPKHFRPLSYREHARRYGHDLQIGFYALSARTIGFDIRSAALVVVENDHPFDVCVYRIERPKLNALIGEVENALRGYAECLASGSWPGVGGDYELDLFPQEHQQTEKDQLLENQTELSGGPLADNPNDNEQDDK